MNRRNLFGFFVAAGAAALVPFKALAALTDPPKDFIPHEPSKDWKDKVMFEPGMILHIVGPGGGKHFPIPHTSYLKVYDAMTGKIVYNVRKLELTLEADDWIHGTVTVTKRRPDGYPMIDPFTKRLATEIFPKQRVVVSNLLVGTKP